MRPITEEAPPTPQGVPPLESLVPVRKPRLPQWLIMSKKMRAARAQKARSQIASSRKEVGRRITQKRPAAAGAAERTQLVEALEEAPTSAADELGGEAKAKGAAEAPAAAKAAASAQPEQVMPQGEEVDKGATASAAKAAGACAKAKRGSDSGQLIRRPGMPAMMPASWG